MRERFSGNVLGVAWVVLAPLLQLAVFALVFVHIFKARVPGLDERGYVVFLALGMWPWFAFSEAIGRGAAALTDNAGLLGKVAVSTWDVVAARVISAFLIHGAGFLLIVAVLALWHGGVAWTHVPLVLPSWLGMFILALALAQIAAICAVFARDVQQILGYLLTAWMFLTPILYDPRLLPPAMADWLRFNPMAAFVHGVRGPLLWRDLSDALPGGGMALALMALLLAGWMHRRFRPYLREFL